MPRPINTTTRIGQLRTILGLKAREFSTLAGISFGTLRLVEAGYNTLSTATTERIAFATGVDPQWLLGNGEDLQPTWFDPKAGRTAPFTRDDFTANRDALPAESIGPVLETVIHASSLKVLASLQNAARHNTLGAALYLVDRLLQEMPDKLGWSAEDTEKMRRAHASETESPR